MFRRITTFSFLFLGIITLLWGFHLYASAPGISPQLRQKVKNQEAPVLTRISFLQRSSSAKASSKKSGSRRKITRGCITESLARLLC